MYSSHEEFIGTVAAPPAEVFAHLDDQTRLSAHMSKRSWKMGWGRMEIILDEGRGQTIGSHIILSGRVFGIRLYVDEVVKVRETPHRKGWETIGEPRLLVIGRYRMGFTLTSRDAATSELRVEIDYDLPRRGLSSVLGKLFGRAYAKWCTRQMAEDAKRTFAARVG